MPSLEERVAKIERLLRLGGLGDDDLRAIVGRHSALLGRLTEDRSIGNALLGEFPSVDSSMSVRRAGSEVYLGGTLNLDVTLTVVAELTANRLKVVPFYLPGTPNLVNIIGLQVTTLEVGGLIRLGIYDDNGNLYPGNLLLDAGAVATDTTGIKTIAIKESFSRGLKWLAYNSNAVVAEVLSASGTSVWPILGRL